MNGENIAVISDRFQVALKCAAVYLNTAVFKFLMYFGDSGPSVLRYQAQNADHCDHIFKHCGGSGVFVHLVTSGVR